MSDRVPTGIEGFDSLIEGGFPRGSLILLTGDTGSGKTIFSAQYLYYGASKFDEPGIYVSFAENRETFLNNMKRMNIDLERYEQEGRFKFLDFPTVTERLIEQIFRSILEEIRELKAKRLVVDSISAMAQAFKEPINTRIVFRDSLSKMVHQEGCTALAVVEMPKGGERTGLGIEEFIADGVILLRNGKFKGHLLRDLRIKKLRGTRLPETTLIFTLEDGFECFSPFEPRVQIEKPKRFQATLDLQDRFSTGTPDLDAILGGGARRGSSILLEFDEKVLMLQYNLFVAPMVANFVAQGKGAWILPSSGVDYEAVRRMALIYGFSEEEFRSLVHVSDFRTESKFSFDEIELRCRTGKPILALLDADILATKYGEDECEKILHENVSHTRQFGSLAVLVLRSGRETLIRRLSGLAGIHLQLTTRHGALLLRGIKPRTGLHAVEMDVSKGFALPRLTPIV